MMHPTGRLVDHRDDHCNPFVELGVPKVAKEVLSINKISTEFSVKEGKVLATVQYASNAYIYILTCHSIGLCYKQHT